MGFRCPKCHKDFGVNKKALEEHIPQCAGIALNDLLEAVDAKTKDVTKVTVLHSMLADTKEKLSNSGDSDS